MSAIQPADSAAAQLRLGPLPAMLAALATGALFALAEPPVGAWPLAFVCLAPLLASLAGRSLGARAGLGALAGAAASIAVAIGPAAAGASGFFALPYWQGLALASAVGLWFGAIGFVVFAVLAGDPLRGGPIAAIARAALAFAAAEWVRGAAFSGLPWLLLAYALAPQPALLGLAPLGGVALLSAWLAATSAALVRALLGPDRVASAIALGAITAIGVGAGALAPANAREGRIERAGDAGASGGAIRVALAQPAIPLASWSDPARARETVDDLVAVSLALGAPVDLLVWPENAVQVLLPANRGLVEKALARLDGRAAHLLLGAPRYDPAHPLARYNAALLFASDGAVLGWHDKTKPLPIFERTPPWLRGWLPAGTDVVAADAPSVLSIPGARLAPLICYEVLFPAIAAEQVRGGADLLLNLSNDAWFGGSGGAEQHFAAAVVLAATLARPLLRSTPTGVTGAIDASGRVIARLPPDRAGLLELDVFPASRVTPAARVGWILGPLAAIAALGWLAVPLARRRS